MMPLAIGQERSIRLIDDVVSGDRFLALVTAKDASIDAPGFDDIYDVGTVAIVHKMIKIPDGTLRILVGGLHRVKLVERVSDDPYLVGEFDALPDENDDTPEVEALTRNVQGLFAKIIGLAPYLPAELQLAAANVDDPSALAHLVASTLRTIPTEERQELLETGGRRAAVAARSRRSSRARPRCSSSARRSSRRSSPRWRRASASTSCASS